ncbi:hypothetical protein [Treponema sp.]|uniref:hypothetical protein n=1 Tax=Treponema sp. TaxID=166 RepID=UPI003EFC6742
MKFFTSFFLLAFFSVAAIFSQSSQMMEKTVYMEKVSYGTAAYFTASALGWISDNATEQEALEAWKQKEVRPGIAGLGTEISADDPIDFEHLAWLCAFTWDIPESLMMKVFHSPRYAFKQLRACKIIPASFDPKRIPTGREFLNIITDCVDIYELKEF